MSSPFPAPPLTRAQGRRGLPQWMRVALVCTMVLVVSLILAQQIVAPNVRTAQILLVALLVVAALRVSSFTSLLFLALAIPTYKPTTYGGTTLAFVLVIFILWQARLALKLEKTAGRSAIDLPVAAFLACFIFSFSQLSSADEIRPALFNLFALLTHIFLAYMTIHVTRTETQLRRLVAAIVVMAVLMDLSAVFELAYPGRPLIPGWVNLGAEWVGEYTKQGLEIKNLRVAGVFYDYELLAEFCAMVMVLFWFVFIRCRTLLTRLGMIALLALNSLVLLATVTRGAIVSLAVGAAYLVYVHRRRIRMQTFAIALVAVFAGGWFLLDFVGHHTRSGSVLERFEKTEFKGVVPDTRWGAWSGAMERILQRPIFGHGPYYSFKVTEGVKKIYWPHNNYLAYWHMLGIVGVLLFLWLLFTLWRQTRFHAPYLADPSYTGSLLLTLRAILLLFMVDQIKIEFVRNPVYPYWVWLFFGLIVATSRIAREEKPVPDGAAIAPMTTKRRLPAVAAQPAVGQ